MKPAEQAVLSFESQSTCFNDECGGIADFVGLKAIPINDASGNLLLRLEPTYKCRICAEEFNMIKDTSD